MSPDGPLPDHRVALVHRFFSGTGTTYDRRAVLNTFGFDIWWKEKILQKIPEGSMQIMDQGCGTGILTLRIAKRFPHARVVGVELRDEYLRIARKKARVFKSGNIEFILSRAEDVLLGDRFDCIVSSYLAKYAQLPVLIQNAQKMLRNGGVLIMHDFTYPRGRLMAVLWEFYFRLLQTAGEYSRWREIYSGLPGLLRETKWVSELVHILKENHFAGISIQRLTLGTSAIITARRG